MSDPAADLLAAAHLFHKTALLWHDAEPEAPRAGTDIGLRALHLHKLNFDLWHHEDVVRRLGAADHEVARRKRCIDDLNARRNAAIEDLDAELLARLRPNPDAPTHTETPGTIADRLSILALRIAHTDTVEGASSRLAVLAEQFGDLSGGLEQLLGRVRDGEVGFKLYRQFKGAEQGSYCALFEGRA